MSSVWIENIDALYHFTQYKHCPVLFLSSSCVSHAMGTYDHFGESSTGIKNLQESLISSDHSPLRSSKGYGEVWSCHPCGTPVNKYLEPVQKIL